MQIYLNGSAELLYIKRLPFSHKNSTISLVPKAEAQLSRVCPTSSVKLTSTAPLETAASSASVSLPRMQSMSCRCDLSPRAPLPPPDEPSPLAPPDALDPDVELPLRFDPLMHDHNFINKMFTSKFNVIYYSIPN